jgi:putative FmdB family regulatory protein
MPIYEFVCRKCKADFEELVMSQAEKVACPKCGSKRVERAMSTFSYASGGTFRHASGDECGSCAKGSCSGCGHSH